MKKKLIRNAKLINEGQILDRDVLVVGRRIDKIAPSISVTDNTFLIDAKGKYLIPGMIDDQVHFRDRLSKKPGGLFQCRLMRNAMEPITANSVFLADFSR